MDVTNPHFLNNISNLLKLMVLDDQQSQEPKVSKTPAAPPRPSSRDPQQGKKICNFCKRNGEMSAVFLSHNLREDGKVACPVLRKHVCELCGASGDVAHTRSYCLMAAAGRGMTANSTDGHYYHNSVVLKQTGRNSFGKKRAQHRSHPA